MTNSDSIEDWGIIDIEGSNEDYKLGKEVEGKEKRTNWQHVVRHCIAVLIVLAYLALLINCSLWGSCLSQLPDSFLALVSAVVGFYFGSRNSE